MKTVILAGGFGTRLSEQTHLIPKPLVQVGALPILHHIINIYVHFGHTEFILALGYKSELIVDYFDRLFNTYDDVLYDFIDKRISRNGGSSIPFKVRTINTGLNTMTGGRLLRLKDYLKDESDFFLTYGDGVSNVDINQLYDFHRASNKLATITAVRPAARFGCLTVENNLVSSFKEKPQTETGWINGGFFVFKPSIFDYLEDDSTVLEGLPLEQVASDSQLSAFLHSGFWQCMDTKRDVDFLNKLVSTDQAPWIWK